MKLLNTFFFKHGRIMLFLLLSVLAGCKKDRYKCVDFPPPPLSPGGYEGIPQGNIYLGFSFNPADESEMCGYRVGPTGFELYRYNLLTRQFSVIADANLFYGDVHWGRNGWLLLSGRDWNIYKIKPDGDSLTQITYTGNCIRTSWNYDASRIIYFNNSINRPVILNPETGESTVIEGEYPTASSDWSSYPDLAMGKTETYFFRYHPSDGFVEKAHTDAEGYHGPFAYIDKETCVLSKMNEGIYIFEWNTKNYKMLRPSCDSRRYFIPRFNRQQNRLYFARIDKTLRNKLTYDYTVILVSMNIDGSDEQVIELP